MIKNISQYINNKFVHNYSIDMKLNKNTTFGSLRIIPRAFGSLQIKYHRDFGKVSVFVQGVFGRIQI